MRRMSAQNKKIYHFNTIIMNTEFPNVIDSEVIVSVDYAYKGSAFRAYLMPSDDFFNEACVRNKAIGIVMNGIGIYFGYFESIEDSNGVFYVNLRSSVQKCCTIALPVDKIVGYFVYE